MNILFKRVSNLWVPTTLFTGLAILFTYISLANQARNILPVIALILTGLVSWTLVEYILHRFIFHWTQVKEPWKGLASGLHMAHHRTPDQDDIILAPPFVGLVFSVILYFVFAAVTWSWTAAALLEAGMFMGYVAYEWVHFGAHRFKMKRGIGKYLQQYHLRHHFKNPKGFFGVTSPLWDYVFRSL